jgi:hypothetical protein
VPGFRLAVGAMENGVVTSGADRHPLPLALFRLFWLHGEGLRVRLETGRCRSRGNTHLTVGWAPRRTTMPKQDNTGPNSNEPGEPRKVLSGRRIPERGARIMETFELPITLGARRD